MDGNLPSLGGSPTNPRVVTHQKEVFNRFYIWLLDLVHKTKTKWLLPWMVTHQPRMVTYQKNVYYRQFGTQT